MALVRHTAVRLMTTAYTSFFDYNKTVAMALRMRYSKAFHSNCFSFRSVFMAVKLISDLTNFNQI